MSCRRRDWTDCYTNYEWQLFDNSTNRMFEPLSPITVIYTLCDALYGWKISAHLNTRALIYSLVGGRECFRVESRSFIHEEEKLKSQTDY